MRSTVLVTSLQLCFESCPRSYTGPLIVLMLSMLFMISEKWWSLAKSYKFCANELTGVPFLILSVTRQRKEAIKAAANEVPRRFKGNCKIKWPHQFFPTLNLWVHPGTKDCFCKFGHLEFKVKLSIQYKQIRSSRLIWLPVDVKHRSLKSLQFFNVPTHETNQFVIVRQKVEFLL